MKKTFLLIAGVALASVCHAQTVTTASGVSKDLAGNPSMYGKPSAGDATLTTGAMTLGSMVLTLEASTSFSVSQGVFVSHAGKACGAVRGTVCSGGPIPALSTVGAAGVTRYAYRVSCLDGLGGMSPASRVVTIESGKATLSAANHNLMTLMGTAGCIEIAVYRNNALIGLRYAPSSGSYTYSDIGQAAVGSHRDIPLTPPASSLNDNLVAMITVLSGNAATLSVAAGATVAGAKVYHSDTPLVQAAIANSKNLKGDANYRINYPVNLVNSGGMLELALLCDTGDICVDATGEYQLTLNNVSLNSYGAMTQGSTIGLYCSRNATRPLSQLLNSNNLYINMVGAVSATGKGSVAFYNYGCEIENHVGVSFHADQLTVLTSGNIWNVPSLFDGTQLSGAQSMSQLTFVQPDGGTGTGAFWTLDNTYTVSIFGGYNNGGGSTTYPYAFEIFGQSADIRVIGYRTELRTGFAHINTGGKLVYSTIDYGLYRSGVAGPTILLEDGASVSQVNLRADDYGGSPTAQPIYSCVTSNCSFANSTVQLGYWQTFDPTHSSSTVTQAVNGGAMGFSGPFTWTTARWITGTDLNTVTACGYYDGASMKNGPAAFGSKYMRVQVVCSADAEFLNQVAYDMSEAGTNTSYIRNRNSGTWGAWQLVAAPGIVGFSGTKTVGSCVMTFANGIVTGISGC
jgi:hypothetical protein